MADVNFDAKTNWKQDETVYPADANRWEEGIKNCADAINDNNTEIPKKVNKAGDTMTGTLKMSGENEIRFGTDDNFYCVKKGTDGLMQGNGANENRLLTTADLGGSTTITPVGSLIMGPIPEAQTPAGYLFCNGQAVSRTTYAALFSILGINFGAGDGSTTFNVPDYRDCFLRGLGTKNNSFYVKQGSGIPNIAGLVSNIAYGGTGPFTLSTSDGRGYGATDGRNNNRTFFNASAVSSIYQDNLNEARPVNFAINYFIKY